MHNSLHEIEIYSKSFKHLSAITTTTDLGEEYEHSAY